MSVKFKCLVKHIVKITCCLRFSARYKSLNANKWFLSVVFVDISIDEIKKEFHEQTSHEKSAVKECGSPTGKRLVYNITLLSID